MPDRGWRRTLLNLALLPLAVVVVLLEDVVWASARAVLRWANGWAPVRRLRAWLGTWSGYAALPLFLVPEILGRVGEIWAVALLVGGRLKAGVAVYIIVRVVATLVAVFIYHSCERALLRVAWFAAVIGWVQRARDWALGLMGPWYLQARRALLRGPSRAATRFLALRRALGQRWRL